MCVACVAGGHVSLRQQCIAGCKNGSRWCESRRSSAHPSLPLQTHAARFLVAGHRHFSGVWEDRDESDNFAQKHDVSLAKDKIRPSVVEEIRNQVCAPGSRKTSSCCTAIL